MRRRWNVVAIFIVLLLVFTACGQFKSSDDYGQSVNEGSVSDSIQEEPLTFTVDLYFADNQLMDMYKVEKEVQVEEEQALPEETLKQWIQGPEQEELVSLIPEDTKVNDIWIVDGLATIDFSPEIMHANVGSTGELFILDQLALILQQFDAQKVQILVDGAKVETLYGHIKVEEPYSYEQNNNYQINTVQ